MKKKLKTLCEEVLLILILGIGVFTLCVFGVTRTQIPLPVRIVMLAAMIQWCKPLATTVEDFCETLRETVNERRNAL